MARVVYIRKRERERESVCERETSSNRRIPSKGGLSRYNIRVGMEHQVGLVICKALFFKLRSLSRIDT